jgi:long-subunit acyl-CoA synthetase (AMP-forming)
LRRPARYRGAEPLLGEVGEIAIRGHSIMTGYGNKPETTHAKEEATDVDEECHTAAVGRGRVSPTSASIS